MPHLVTLTHTPAGVQTFPKNLGANPDSGGQKCQMKKVPYQGSRILVWPVNLTVIWYILLGACALLRTVCEGGGGELRWWWWKYLAPPQKIQTPGIFYAPLHYGKVATFATKQPIYLVTHNTRETCFKMLKHSLLMMTYGPSGAQIPGTTSPWPPNFFTVAPNMCGSWECTCFMAPLWRLEVWYGS
jgi:hypothetical protein